MGASQNTSPRQNSSPRAAVVDERADLGFLQQWLTSARTLHRVVGAGDCPDSVLVGRQWLDELVMPSRQPAASLVSHEVGLSSSSAATLQSSALSHGLPLEHPEVQTAVVRRFAAEARRFHLAQLELYAATLGLESCQLLNIGHASGFTAMLIFFDARCKTLLRSSSAGRRPDRGRSYAKGAADARKAVAQDMVHQEVLLRLTGFDRADQRRDTAAEYELRLADVRADIADQHPDESWPCMRTVVGHHNKHHRAAGPSPAQMMRALRSEFPSGFEGASAWRAECLRLSRVAFAATADAAVTRHVSPLSRAIVDRNFKSFGVTGIGLSVP